MPVGPDFTGEAWVPADATFVLISTDLTGPSEDNQVRSVWHSACLVVLAEFMLLTTLEKNKL